MHHLGLYPLSILIVIASTHHLNHREVFDGLTQLSVDEPEVFLELVAEYLMEHLHCVVGGCVGIQALDQTTSMLCS